MLDGSSGFKTPALSHVRERKWCQESFLPEPPRLVWVCGILVGFLEVWLAEDAYDVDMGSGSFEHDPDNLGLLVVV